ncbi:hypothetical protein SK128_010066 [Halocaridina rubra]|uniref:Uncharacterized protein n=1 Tax=Halocaridina rubra TaxID=373956 RepID=A0AAN8XIP0_HALRR
MDLSSETVSLAASDANATATTPRDTLPDPLNDSHYSDAHTAPWPPWTRRSSCQSQSVVSCSTVSKSGPPLCNSDGEEGAWWAATWARGSWEGMTAPSPTPESLNRIRETRVRMTPVPRI